jgi:SAM-dependent methyltransferase
MRLASNKARMQHRSPIADRVQAVLSMYPSGDHDMAPDQVDIVDRFYASGFAATAELAAMAGMNSGTVVLDVGAGFGGTARRLAQAFRCPVIGLDLCERRVEAARRLAERDGAPGLTSFRVGDVLAPPFPSGSFEVALLRLTAMNIADRRALYRALHRVVAPGGRVAIFDAVRGNETPDHPLPWAETPEASTLWPAAETRGEMERAGLHPLVWREEWPVAIDWARFDGEPRSWLPPDMAALGDAHIRPIANLARALAEKRIGLLTAVAQAD